VKVLGVDNVFVPVGDLAEALRFYGGVLGLPVTKRFDELGMALSEIGDPWHNVVGFTDYTAKPELGRLTPGSPAGAST
jgi:catechol 2,3-dioxygenase-like lactoylglutathione lyase family enzyme